MSFSLTYKRLTKDFLNTANVLCDECVGKNLYSHTYLASIIDDPAHFFYILVTKEKEAVGYIYFFLTDLESISDYFKLPYEKITVVSERENSIIGNLQSIGVKETYRGHQLSEELVHFYLNNLKTRTEADAAFGVFWKVGGIAPMEKTLKTFDFIYIMDAHHVWYDNKELVCPYCRGACECDAAVYYKKIERRS